VIAPRLVVRGCTVAVGRDAIVAWDARVARELGPASAAAGAGDLGVAVVVEHDGRACGLATWLFFDAR